MVPQGFEFFFIFGGGWKRLQQNYQAGYTVVAGMEPSELSIIIIMFAKEANEIEE